MAVGSQTSKSLRTTSQMITSSPPIISVQLKLLPAIFTFPPVLTLWHCPLIAAETNITAETIVDVWITK